MVAPDETSVGSEAAAAVSRSPVDVASETEEVASDEAEAISADANSVEEDDGEASTSSDEEEGDEGYRRGGYHPVRIGEEFSGGRYVVHRKLGWGHFSTVWLCWDTEERREVALKVQKSAKNYTEAAYDEVTILGEIKSGGGAGRLCTLTLLDNFEHKGPNGTHVCFVFEVLGENLLSLIKRFGYRGVPMTAVREIARQVLLALDYLHGELSIIHTDLKPENVLLVDPIEWSKPLDSDADFAAYHAQAAGAEGGGEAGEAGDRDRDGGGSGEAGAGTGNYSGVSFGGDSDGGAAASTASGADAASMSMKTAGEDDGGAGADSATSGGAAAASAPSMAGLTKNQKKKARKKARKAALAAASAAAEANGGGDSGGTSADAGARRSTAQSSGPPVGARIVRHGRREGLGTRASLTRDERRRAAEHVDARMFSIVDGREGAVRCKVVDVGNACWVHRQFTEDIQTRQYRSPEVILGAKYSTPADIWSVACMLFELATGDLLFDPHSGKDYSRDEDHLALMSELLGKLPKKVALGGKYSRDYFTRNAELRHIKASSLKPWPLYAVLEEKYGFPTDEAAIFADFLVRMLDFAPGQRASAAEALAHPWITGETLHANGNTNGADVAKAYAGGALSNAAVAEQGG